MFKKISILFGVLAIMSSINSTNYMKINPTTDVGSIIVAEYSNVSAPPESVLTCTLPEVLNDAKDACEVPSPVIVCVDPEVLNSAQDACTNSVEDVAWIYTDGDTCGGMRQMNFDSKVYIARSRSNVRDMFLTIPQGYHWLSRNDYSNLFNSSTVSNKYDNIRNYFGQCGLAGNAMSGGIAQVDILFEEDPLGANASTYEKSSATNNASNQNNFLGYFLYKDYEGTPAPLTCTLPEVLNDAQDACEIPAPVCTLPEVLNHAQEACEIAIQGCTLKYTDGDTCGGMRQMNFNPNIYIARSRSNVINMTLEIPEGYHWLSRNDYGALFSASTVSNKYDNIKNYFGQCGLAGNAMSGGVPQVDILFEEDPLGANASNYEKLSATNNGNNPNNFLGYFLYKD